MKILALSATLLMSASAFSESSFNEVREVLFGANPTSSNATVKSEMKAYEKNGLPHYEVTSSKFIVAGVDHLLDRAKKTLNDKEDYYPRLEKLVHPNGVCFTGTWNITEKSSYSGYFKNKATGLFVGRASTALTETERGDSRGMGFAGKIFPTLDKDAKVPTANFFLVDVLMGEQRDRYLDVGMTNNPDLGFRFSLLAMALKISKTFKKVDTDPLYRPLYPISELNLDAPSTSLAPKFMMLKADKSVARNDDADFRDELSIRKNHPDGIRLNIMVNDKTADQGSKEWIKLGYIQLDESTTSYGCDRRLHFAHPKMR
ncbi:MAG: hypothetical protein K2Q18_08495 [Bdellovibrionales bacterium]|nr:hypothetical protein [Bdellovibrionales bacterium]